MVARVKLKVQPKKKVSAGGNYFAAPKKDVDFIKTGCKVLDLALGGGWVMGRVGNVVGDKATGKTLLMIEACANFLRQYPKGKIRYREAESAFDQDYAAALGMPVRKVDFGGREQLDTIEDFFEDLNRVCAASDGKHPELYILDSLDALSDRAEQARDMDAGTYGQDKAKKLSQMFRRVIRKLERKNITLLVVSQVRANIGVTYGRTTKRSGGRALDFYASQVVYLAQIKTLSRDIGKVKRPWGVTVRAKIDKNKVGLPYREVDFNLLFGFGIDDARACVEWMRDANSLGAIDMKGYDTKKINTFLADLMNADNDDYESELKMLHEAVTKRWYDMEASLLPKRKKYG